MAKALTLTDIAKAAEIKNIPAGSIVKLNQVGAEPVVVAVEINNATGQRAVLPESPLWMRYAEGTPVITYDKRLPEYYA